MEINEVVEWYKPMEEWNSFCCMEFMSWLAKYKEESPDLTIDEAVDAFRAVMDVGYGEQREERYATGWTDARGIFGT